MSRMSAWASLLFVSFSHVCVCVYVCVYVFFPALSPLISLTICSYSFHVPTTWMFRNLLPQLGWVNQQGSASSPCLWLYSLLLWCKATQTRTCAGLCSPQSDCLRSSSEDNFCQFIQTFSLCTLLLLCTVSFPSPRASPTFLSAIYIFKK